MGERRTARPHEFTEQDVAPDRFYAGTQRTLEDFYAWQSKNPDAIATHVDSFTGYLEEAMATHSLRATLKRSFSPGARKAFKREELRRDVGSFSVHNLGEMPDEDTLEKFGRYFSRDTLGIRKLTQGADATTITDAFERHIPSLRGQPELPWLDAQMQRLYRILPEEVIQAGGMGKVARTIAGVLAIGLYDTIDEPLDVQKAHLTRVLPGAYAYGAMYAIIDDTLQDGVHIPAGDKDRYHKMILRGVRTGECAQDTELPDHPLAEELQRLQGMLLETFPFEEYRHLYYAGESMYEAQHRDSTITPEDIALGGLRSIYPDIFVKASMSRVVANILGRRAMPGAYYKQAINIHFLNQFRDDLKDVRADREAGRMTPFSYEGSVGGSPLSDLFGYSAYIADALFDDNPAAADMFTSFSAYSIAAHFLNDPDHASELLNFPETTDEMARFIERARVLPPRARKVLKRPDTELQSTVANISRHRPQTEIDPRTFVLDRINYINNIVQAQNETGGALDEVTKYALDAGGKRLRPALTLMLAEGMGVDYSSAEPLIKTVELFHTASLIFDDLPAQDNASLRRGKPTSHKAFGEARAQLAGISMISSGFGGLAELQKAYSAERILNVLEYCGTILGPQRLCLGQDMDLAMAGDATVEDIIEMYNLKTSTLIEAALVPVMMLEGRPVEEIELVKTFSYHAGIVFQLRDDVLDITANSEEIGKDTNSDTAKTNVARLKGVDAAEALIEKHLEAALTACRHLPFNTTLLEETARHFAARKQ